MIFPWKYFRLSCFIKKKKTCIEMSLLLLYTFAIYLSPWWVSKILICASFFVASPFSHYIMCWILNCLVISRCPFHKSYISIFKKKKMAKRSEGERFSFIYSLFFFLSLFVSKYKQRERITFEDLCRKTSQRKDV